ncbi:MAG: isopropylmalate isomerase [Pseudomonadota bacterium]
MFEPALTECVFADWSPTIGDPTPLGWFTVGAYVIAALLIASTSVRLSGGERWLWVGCAVLLAFLAVNKQLDLQSFLTAAGRCHAKLNGWYEDRRALQETFIYAIAGGGLAIFLLLVLLLRRAFLRNVLLFTGLLALLSFIAMRAAGAHHFDRFINLAVGPFRMNHVLELGGIALFVLAAIVRIRTLRRLRKRETEEADRRQKLYQEMVRRRRERANLPPEEEDEVETPQADGRTLL